MTEEKEKESSKAQLDFLAPIQLTTTTERGGGGEGQKQGFFSQKVNLLIAISILFPRPLPSTYKEYGWTSFLVPKVVRETRRA